MVIFSRLPQLNEAAVSKLQKIHHSLLLWVVDYGYRNLQNTCTAHSWAKIVQFYSMHRSAYVPINRITV